MARLQPPLRYVTTVSAGTPKTTRWLAGRPVAMSSVQRMRFAAPESAVARSLCLSTAAPPTEKRALLVRSVNVAPFHKRCRVRMLVRSTKAAMQPTSVHAVTARPVTSFGLGPTTRPPAMKPVLVVSVHAEPEPPATSRTERVVATPVRARSVWPSGLMWNTVVKIVPLWPTAPPRSAMQAALSAISGRAIM